MSGIDIRLFGGLQVVRGGAPQAVRGEGARFLLTLLALQPERRFPRDVLCGLLWGERTDAAARKALRNSLWRLRSALEREEIGDPPVLDTDGGRLGLVPDLVRVDVHRFERATDFLDRAARPTLTPDQAQRLEEAVALYRGDLMDGIYEAWCVVPRERLRLRYLAALDRLAWHRRERGELRAALILGQRLLRHDPLREAVHRQVMRLHWDMGNRPSALRQYEECRRILRRELDIEPMEETTALRDRIRSGVGPAPVPSMRGMMRPKALESHPPTAPESVARSVQEALDALSAATDRLRHLQDSLEEKSGS